MGRAKWSDWRKVVGRARDIPTSESRNRRHAIAAAMLVMRERSPFPAWHTCPLCLETGLGCQACACLKHGKGMSCQQRMYDVGGTRARTALRQQARIRAAEQLYAECWADLTPAERAAPVVLEGDR